MITNPPFFIISTGRSGSTSLARILNLADNGTCTSEPSPNLNVESRNVLDGRISEQGKYDIIRALIKSRLLIGISENEIYGEKNVTYGPFVDVLYKEFNAKFIFLYRDGRDVVTSFMNWNDKKFGSIYREAAQPTGNLSVEAIVNSSKLLAIDDASDYSRVRPAPGDPLYAEWFSLSRFEMCSYYWNRMNLLHLDQFSRIPKSNVISLDYTDVSPEKVLEVLDFVGLKGIDREIIKSELDKKLNSLKDRGSEEGKFPSWQHWDSSLRKSFERFGTPAMEALGYWNENLPHWKPTRYGEIWEDFGANQEWFRWMYKGREHIHHHFQEWFSINSGSIKTIVEFGCGISFGYNLFFKDKRYVGIDISKRNIDYCLANYHNPNHSYLTGDFSTVVTEETFDLVYSSGTLDNTYDIDLALEAMSKMTRKFLYFTLYRGWKQDLEKHSYAWSEKDKCYYNNYSYRLLKNKLHSLGFKNVVISPLSNGWNNPEIPYEVLVLAEKVSS